MAQAETVYRCDECSRVVATLNPDGSLTVQVRHEKEIHRTNIVATVLERRETAKICRAKLK